MEMIRKITAVAISIILFGGPQLYEVDAIEISSDIKSTVFKEIKL